jgi:hypothetical protein
MNGESQIHEASCYAEEGRTVVPTVKDTCAATSLIPKPRLVPARRRRPFRLRRRFAAEVWVKPEVDPPKDWRCRAGL